MSEPTERSLNVVAISGSPSAASKSARLLERVVELLDREGARVTHVTLAELPAGDLLGRSCGPQTDEALEAVAAADIILVATPVYRATYSGLLKVFFDLMPRDYLQGKVGVPLATGAVAQHQGVLADVARLFESLGALVVATGAYGLDADFSEGQIDSSLARRVDRAGRDAIELFRTRSSHTSGRAE